MRNSSLAVFLPLAAGLFAHFVQGFQLRRQPQSESYLVTGKAFFTFHNIPMDKLRRYTARLYEGDVLWFSLKDDEVK